MGLREMYTKPAIFVPRYMGRIFLRVVKNQGTLSSSHTLFKKNFYIYQVLTRFLCISFYVEQDQDVFEIFRQ